jgi:hypothetical protein
MPLKASKQFSETAEALETLADGVKIHSGETNFPATLVEADIREEKGDLETLREDYEKAQAAADKKYGVYKKKFDSCNTNISSAQRTLQGFYGLRSQTLKDFGFQPPKPGGKKGPHTPSA